MCALRWHCQCAAAAGGGSATSATSTTPTARNALSAAPTGLRGYSHSASVPMLTALGPSCVDSEET